MGTVVSWQTQITFTLYILIQIPTGFQHDVH